MIIRKLKKYLAVALAGVMTLSLVACGSGNDKGEETTKASMETSTEYVAQNVKVAAMKGPTAIGMVKIMQDNKEGKAANKYGFTIAASADVFTSSLIKGDVQLAAVPCNVASTLYNKSGGKIKVVGINTLGVLYIMENSYTTSAITSVSDLKGRTIYLTGKGTTPEYTMRYLLKSAGLDPDKDVKLEFKSEASEVATAMMISGNSTVVGMLPQPYVTTVTMKDSMMRVALDVTKEWEKLNGADNTVVTGVLVANADYYDKNKVVVDKFMEEYEASVNYVNSNVDAAAQLVEEAQIFKADVAKKAIPECNITLIKGNAMKTKVSNYLKVLYDENPNAIGGKMPDDGFYVTE
ncbi:MAG: ABC transporter substrate-binding protein [Lachnospira sp.]|nr:ABC transporter substrate-binding protein [Lachnospira sp.]